MTQGAFPGVLRATGKAAAKPGVAARTVLLQYSPTR